MLEDTNSLDGAQMVLIAGFYAMILIPIHDCLHQF